MRVAGELHAMLVVELSEARRVHGPNYSLNDLCVAKLMGVEGRSSAARMSVSKTEDTGSSPVVPAKDPFVAVKPSPPKPNLRMADPIERPFKSFPRSGKKEGF